MLFKPGSAHQGNVVLNFTCFPKDEFCLLGKAYHQAGQVLAQHFSEQYGYSDLDACPIVFLYRQSLELMLKAILLTGNRIADRSLNEQLRTSENKLFSSHRLSECALTLERIFETAGEDSFVKFLGVSSRTFASLLKEFDDYDSTSSSFRYPTKRDGTEATPKNFTFAVLGFVEIMDPLLERLYAATMTLGLQYGRGATPSHDF